MKNSKQYRELAGEQREDGSWGRFHTMDSKTAEKQKFKTTENALKRARELSLTKDDPMIAKCIKLMERYVRGEETWPDKIEKHHDNGKSHLRSCLFISAANINLFDPENPVVKPMREIVAKTLEIALSKGYFDEKAWVNENLNYRGPCFSGWNAYPLMILQNSDCMDDELQRKYLDYIWNRECGVYYLSNFPLSEKRYSEDKFFNAWLNTLEHLSGFSLFSEFMKNDVLFHLLHEANRLLNEKITIPKSYNTRYAESWRDKNNRKTDMVLRLARLIERTRGRDKGTVLASYGINLYR
jgi:hypothetical protein